LYQCTLFKTPRKVFKILDMEIKRCEKNMQCKTTHENIRQHSLMTNIKRTITEDATMNLLMDVYNYIDTLEKKT